MPEVLCDGLAADPAAALAREEALLAAVADGGPPLLRLWRVPRCLVAPQSYARRPGFASAAARSAAAGWPLLLRLSGGAPVPLDAGTLNVSLFLRRPAGAAPAADYAALLALLRRGLAPLALPLGEGPVVGSFCDGRFNLTLGGRKLAGTAQRRRPMPGGLAVLAQALLLLDSDLQAGCAALNAFLGNLGEPPVALARHTTLARHCAQPPEVLLRLATAGLAAAWTNVDAGAAVCSG